MPATIDTERRQATVSRKHCCRCHQPIQRGDWIELAVVAGYKVWCHDGCAPAGLEVKPVVERETVAAPTFDMAKLVDEAAGKVVESLAVKLSEDLAAARDGAANHVLAKCQTMLRESAAALADYIDQRFQQQPAGVQRIEIHDRATDTIRKIDGVTHQAFARILQLATCRGRDGFRKNIFLPGPTGCGKTHTAEQVAQALGLEFSCQSLSGGVTEGKLVGRANPNLTTGENVYVPTEFVVRFETGGVFLADEIDAADQNVLIIINSALANGYLALDRREQPIARRHPDFVCIAAANTFGRGADRQYVGRNQLDGATLDRFRIGTVPMDYDSRVEAALCPDESLRGTLLRWRQAIRDNRLEHPLSTRFMADAYDMVQSGWTVGDVEQAFFADFSEQERRKVLGR